jgi:hypothetical protein
MVAADIASHRHRGRRGVAEELGAAYTLGWTLLLLVAGTCELVPAARWLAHHELALALHVRIRPASPPTLPAAAALLVNNARATGWPVLAVVMRAQHPAWLQRVVHAAVLASLAVNLLPVAAAIGVYRARLVPYLPHLPLELYAITTGPTTWLLSTRQPLTRRQLTLIAGSLLIALTGAALLETWAVPHR